MHICTLNHMLFIKPKNIIIVGASSGLGRQLALLYASAGCRVAIAGRRNNLLQEVRAAFPNQIITACFDATSEDSVWHLQQLVNQLGVVHLIIYNAGFGAVANALDAEIEKQTVATNVAAFVTAVTFAFNYFNEEGQGQIAVTSSVAAARGNGWAPAYSASKSFMSNYAEGLNIKARRLKKNIIITDIKPGFVKTKMAQGHGQFWVASVEKAATQIVAAIENKKRVVYITRRWRLVALLLKWIPYFIYRRIG